MLTLVAALIVAGAVLVGAQRVADAVRASREDTISTRAVTLLAAFQPAIGEAEQDPRAILKWEPVARAARQAWPEEFAKLEQASGGTFPFTKERMQAAHAQWTADWLAWEQTHDTEYKLKTAIAEQELAASPGAPHLRAKLDAIEREKLNLYQRHYADYVRVAKSLQAFL